MRTNRPKFRTFPSKVTRGLHPTPPSNPGVGTPASPKAVTYPDGLVDTQHPPPCVRIPREGAGRGQERGEGGAVVS
jgi:hypothetical protein